MTRSPSSLVPDARQGPGLPFPDETHLRLLRTFAVVVQTGGLSPGAAVLELDLSTVSRQFAELEARLGLRLARRGRGGFALTPEGERLLEHVRRLFDAWRAFGADVAGLAAQRPQLRLGVVDALLTAGAKLPAALGHCAGALPQLQIRLTMMTPVAIERALLAGDLDGGIIAARAAASGLEQHRLYSETSSLYVAPGHPWYDDPARCLACDAAIVADPYTGQWPATPNAARTAEAQADSIEAVALLVASARYAGFLPDHLVRGTQALHALRAVLPQRYTYSQDIVLTCRRGKAGAALRALLRLFGGGL